MTSLVKMKNFEHGSIGFNWFLNKNELDTYISREVPVPEEDKVKSLHKKKLNS